MANENESPIAALKHALLTDRGYLLSWHANLACCTMDALGDAAGEICGELKSEAKWSAGQEAARRFVDLLFGGDDKRPAPVSNQEAQTGRQS